MFQYTIVLLEHSDHTVSTHTSAPCTLISALFTQRKQRSHTHTHTPLHEVCIRCTTINFESWINPLLKVKVESDDSIQEQQLHVFTLVPSETSNTQSSKDVFPIITVNRIKSLFISSIFLFYCTPTPALGIVLSADLWFTSSSLKCFSPWASRCSHALATRRYVPTA